MIAVNLLHRLPGQGNPDSQELCKVQLECFVTRNQPRALTMFTGGSNLLGLSSFKEKLEEVRCELIMNNKSN